MLPVYLHFLYFYICIYFFCLFFWRNLSSWLINEMFLYFRNVSWPCNQQRQNYFQFSDQNCNRLRFLFVSKRFFPELSCRSFLISTFHCIETSQTLPCQTLPLNKVKSGQYIYISFPILAIVSIILQGTTNCTVPVFRSVQLTVQCQYLVLYN